MMGVDFAQRWIPVEEELPEKGVYVICKNEGYLPFIGHYSELDKCFKSVEEPYKKADVTHFRPIEYK